MKSAGVKKCIYFMLRVPMLFVLGVVLMGTVAYGQGSATIVGTVTDPTGAVVPGAKITITDQGNGFVRSNTSNSTGNYSAPELPLGHYQVRVEAQGFKTLEQKDIILDVGVTIRVNAALEVGTVGQSVTVEADALQVQADTNEISQTITGNQIAESRHQRTQHAPAHDPGARRVLQHAGFRFPWRAVPEPQHPVQRHAVRTPTTGSSTAAKPTIVAAAAFCSSLRPRTRFGKFTIATSNYAADLGNSSGGMVSMVIKNGTRRFHGGAWEYNRNDALDRLRPTCQADKVANPTTRKPNSATTPSVSTSAAR